MTEKLIKGDVVRSKVTDGYYVVKDVANGMFFGEPRVKLYAIPFFWWPMNRFELLGNVDELQDIRRINETIREAVYIPPQDTPMAKPVVERQVDEPDRANAKPIERRV